MRKKILRILLIAAAALILLSGGCDVFKKTDYAADASFVINTIALCLRV